MARYSNRMIRLDTDAEAVTHYTKGAYVVETVIRWPGLVTPYNVPTYGFPGRAVIRPYVGRSEEEIRRHAEAEAARETARAKVEERRVVIASKREAKAMLAKSRHRTVQWLRTVHQLRRDLKKAKLVAAAAQDALRAATATKKPR